MLASKFNHEGMNSISPSPKTRYGVIYENEYESWFDLFSWPIRPIDNSENKMKVKKFRGLLIFESFSNTGKWSE